MTELELRHRFDLMDEVKEFALRGIWAQETIDDLREENKELQDEVDTLSSVLTEISELVEKMDSIEELRKEVQRLCDENRI